MRTVEVNGTSVACRERGRGSPVLFIHGTGTYSATFEPVLAELSPGTRAIVYDRRGFGSSPGPPARRLDVHVQDAAALMDVLEAKPATVVGSSGGGVIALRLALTRPDLVSSLVLIEPAYQMALTPSVSAGLALARIHVRWLLQGDAQGAAAWFYRWATSYSTGGNQFDTYPEEWQRTAVHHAPTALPELRQLFSPTPFRRALNQLDIPVWVVIGDSGLPVFHRTSRRVLHRIAQATEIRAAGGHLVYTDDPVTCARTITTAVGWTPSASPA